MGAEFHAGLPEKLEALLRFRPSPQQPVVVHLPRDLNLADAPARGRILDFATRFKGRVHGMVIHDHTDMVRSPEQYLQAALEMEAWLEPLQGSPWLFVEYAAGLDPDVFLRFFESTRALTRISACIDIGHVGTRQAQVAYEQRHPGQDICALKSRPAELPAAMAEIDQAVATSLPTVLKVVEGIRQLGKPFHFHLHDGHPLSTFSPFGVADHLSFRSEIPIGFEHRGRRAVPLMFGPDGLKQIVRRALGPDGTASVTFTLEIHPTFERLPLGDGCGVEEPAEAGTPNLSCAGWGEDAALFSHWVDKTHAEEMNHWVNILTDNRRLVKELLT